MFAGALGEGRRKEARRRAAFAYELAAVLAALLCGAPDITNARDCPPETQVHVPQAPAAPLNIDKVKEVLLAYQAGDYDGDVSRRFSRPRAPTSKAAPAR